MKETIMKETLRNKKKDSNKERQELEKDWREIEKALNYLVRTSKPGLSWQEVLGRGHETDYRLQHIR